MNDVRAKAARIKLVIFDVDGVLTDGRFYFDEQGREYKGFHAHDGLGIKLLRKTGVDVAVISGRVSVSVSKRMDSLGIERVFQGYQNKLLAFDDILKDTGFSPEEIAHVGDDLLDLPLFRRVGLAVAVSNAHPSILSHVDWRTRQPGGYGAAREVCDLIMEAQGKLQDIVEQHY
ncbi:HAD family hydrolase [Methylococcus sp. EFPC2]|uniref:KdsC family phosphatase n=1 Tax=Methylococcus sp. EFPC2 TaxID=2812648 RepID=UPI001967AA2C|nr:HAD-IIIA family hydrolase [Methylococcus sp. EFPC2]QSA97957.1 HAD-IIIA family hydrolase [Methylococcus sp. EFPC2]